MAILEVSTVEEFLNVTPAAGDTVKLMADLDFAGDVFTTHYVKLSDVNNVTWDFNKFRILNLKMTVTDGGQSYVVEVNSFGTAFRRNLSFFMRVGSGCIIKNIELIDVDITANCDFMLFRAGGNNGSIPISIENCKFLVRASVTTYYGVAYYIGSIQNSVFSLSVSASSVAYGVGVNVVGASLLRVEGRISATSVYVVAQGGLIRMSINRSIINVNARATTGSVLVFGLGYDGSAVRDCIVRGNYVAKTKAILGVERVGVVQRLFIDANVSAVDVFGIAWSDENTSVLSDCLVRLNATSTGILRYVTNSVKGSVVNNFRSSRSANNNNATSAETSLNDGTYVLDEEFYNINFLRDVVGFDI